MASRSKAAPAAESTAKAPQAEDPTVALKKMLDEAEPKDTEQPKPVKKNGKGNGEKKAAPAKKALKLYESEGDAKDGEKMRIALPMVGGENVGKAVTKSFVVPKTFFLVKPLRGSLVHVVDEASPERTLCTLATDWASGSQRMADDTFVNCEWCARRLIAAKKLTEAEQTKRQRAAEARIKAAADAAAKAKEAAKKEAAKPEPPKQEAKPDPKPSTRSRGQRRRAKASS